MKQISAVQVCTAFGFALYIFMTNMTIWGGLPLDSTTGLGFFSLFACWSLPLCLAIAISLLACGFLASKKPQVFWGKQFTLLCCFSHLAVLFGYFFVLVSSDTTGTIAVIGAFICGLGLGLASSLWLAVLAHFDRMEVLRLILVSLLMSALLHLVLSLLISKHGMELVFVCATFLAALCMIAARHVFDTMPRAETCDSYAHTSLHQVASAVSNPLYCSMSIAFAVAIIRMLSLTVFAVPTEAIQNLGLLFIAVGAFVLLLINVHAGDKLLNRGTIPLLFRVLFPLVATLLLIISIGGASFTLPVGAAVFAIYTIVTNLMILVCIEVAEEKSISPVSVYGLFAGLVHLAFVVSTFLGIIFIEDIESSSSIYLVSLLIVFYVLAMAFFMMERHSFNRETEGADGGLTENQLLQHYETQNYQSNENSSSAPSSHVPETPVLDNSPRTSRLDRSHEAPLIDSAHETSRLDSALGTSQLDNSPRTSRPDDLSKLSGLDEQPASSNPHEDPINRRCLVLASRYGLSRRETEVLVAFAHGRNVAFLAEKLVLSENTIRSHSKTLYTKLGIHSKQELIDMVESINLDEGHS